MGPTTSWLHDAGITPRASTIPQPHHSEPRCQARASAAGASTGRARQIERVQRLAAEGGCGDAFEREFVEVGLGEEDCAGMAEVSEHGGVVERTERGEGQGAAGGGHVKGVDVVFDEDGDAEQGREADGGGILRAGGDREVVGFISEFLAENFVQGVGGGEGGGVQGDDGVDGRVVGFSLGDEEGGDGATCCLSG
ncbi:predicted protein [Uncinocarpus reesii 1704]|uniref:Uncharacterized protein n=1 Tax=Uncinocarpus reesii (strain UAMH 1704) TaxID=336963 RepID=C4JD97_UNCRE|nr:uncharacterized protein UREG_00292 [Uncinocarpus reesii 1704]EEP75446.1 predicted protein [Uncinocarpus reesii 1704]